MGPRHKHRLRWKTEPLGPSSGRNNVRCSGFGESIELWVLYGWKQGSRSMDYLRMTCGLQRGFAFAANEG